MATELADISTRDLIAQLANRDLDRESRPELFYLMAQQLLRNGLSDYQIEEIGIWTGVRLPRLADDRALARWCEAQEVQHVAP